MELSVLMIISIVTSLCALVSVILNVIMFRRTSAARISAGEPGKVSSSNDAPDEEIVAAIMGAIAESIGKSPSSFKIVSVTSSGGFSTPEWGHADRLTRGIETRSLR